MYVARTCLRHAQETLDTLRQAMKNTGIMCAVMLDTKVGKTPKPAVLLPMELSAA